MRSARHRRPGARPAVAAAAAATTAVLAVAGGIVWWRAGDEPVAAPPCRLPVVPAPTGGPPGGASPGGGRIRVAEQGHSQEVPGRTGPPGRISMGAVLENTGGRIAYRTRVTFAAVDADGQPAVHAGHRSWLVQEVPVVMPGQRVPVGVAHPAGPAGSATARVARVTVTTSVTGWLPPDSASFGTIAVRLTPGGATRDDEGTGAFDYVTESTWCAELKPRGTSMVFRDRAGTLVGGDLLPDGSPERCRPGVNRQRLATNPQAVPSAADPGRTEISEYCDVAPATGLIPGSVLPTGVPIN